MGQKHRKFTAEFKARVALEAIKERKTIAQLSSEFEVHASQISKWKKQAIGAIKTGVSSPSKTTVNMEKQKEDQLYRQIGKLQVENDFLQQAVYPGTA